MAAVTVATAAAAADFNILVCNGFLPIEDFMGPESRLTAVALEVVAVEVVTLLLLTLELFALTLVVSEDDTVGGFF